VTPLHGVWAVVGDVSVASVRGDRHMSGAVTGGDGVGDHRDSELHETREDRRDGDPADVEQWSDPRDESMVLESLPMVLGHCRLASPCRTVHPIVTKIHPKDG
jgi:hypothetical protein